MLLAKVFLTKKHVILFCRLLNLKKKLHELFILCFTGVILSKKWGQTWGVHRKDKKGVGHIGGLSIKFKPGLKPSALYESIQSP